MKKYIVLIIMGLGYFGQAQNYPALQFNTAKTIWDHFTIDENWVYDAKFPLNTKYSNRNIPRLLSENNSLFIYEPCFGKFSQNINNGFLLHRIDLLTGKLIWVYANNSFSGMDDFEANFSSGPILDKSGNIVYIVKVLRNNYLPEENIIKYDCNDKEYIIDHIDGKLLSEKTSNSLDTLIRNGSYGNNFIYMRGINDYIQMTYEVYLENGLTKERAEFANLRDDLNYDLDNIQSIIYPTDIPIQDAIFDFPSFNNQLNKDTFLILNSKIYLEDLAFSPEEAHLRWIDISDKNAIKEVKTMSIRDEYVFPDNNWFTTKPKLITIDNNIVVKQTMSPYVDNKFLPRYEWLLWLDAKGNRMGKLPVVAVGATIYENIALVGVRDNQLLMTGAYRLGDDSYIDLLGMRAGTNEVSKLANIMNYKHRRDTRNYYVTAAKYLDNESIVFGFRMNKDSLNNVSTYAYFMNVKAEDLGIVSSTIDISDRLDVSLSPNPTQTTAQVTFDAPFTGSVEVVALNGSCVVDIQQINEVYSYEVSLSDVLPGLYFVIVRDRQTNQTKTLTLVKN